MSDTDVIDEDTLVNLYGFTKSEAKQILKLMDSGMTLRDAIYEIKEEKKEIMRSKDPVGAAAAGMLTDLSKIAIKKIDTGNGNPILVLENGGKGGTDTETLVNFFKDLMDNVKKSDNPKELEELKSELEELKNLLSGKEKSEYEQKIEELQNSIEIQIAQLKDSIRRSNVPITDSVDLTEILTTLNENGTLNQILKLTEQYLRNRAKQMDIQRNMTLFDKALILSSQVEDVDKVTKILRVLSELTGKHEEEDIEVVEEK